MIERRLLGRTGLAVSVLGFGSSEIGFERVEAATVQRLLLDALDAGLKVVDTAECYGESEAVIGAGAGRVPDRRAPDLGQPRRPGRHRPQHRAGPRARSRRRRQAAPRHRGVATGWPAGHAHHHVHWVRLQRLDYPFLRGSAAAAVGTALRFTAAVPGVHTLIVGTTQPGRWGQNAALLDGGALAPAEFERIRARWREIADASWTGQR